MGDHMFFKNSYNENTVDLSEYLSEEKIWNLKNLKNMLLSLKLRALSYQGNTVW